MCNPTAIVGMQAAGAGSSIAGAYYSAKTDKLGLQAQAGVADSNAHLADINSRLAELTAQSALRQGQQEEQTVRLRTANLKSSQRASMAANGIDLSSDTSVNVLSTTDIMGEIDANTTAANAMRSAWGYRTQATNYQTEAVNYRNDALTKRASSKAISPWLQTGTTLLTSASSVAKNYYMLDKVGAFDKRGA